jgi:predicted membrane protein
MEMLDNNSNLDPEMVKNWERSRRRGKILGGLLVIGIGVVFLGRELGFDIPYWILSWKMFLIALGFIIFMKNPFRHFGGVILMLVGSAFLLEDLAPGIQIGRYIWPVALIVVGLFIIFKPRNKNHNRWRYFAHKQKAQWKRGHYDWSAQAKSPDQIEITSVFGGVKKNIISKNFKGGEITVVFGGAEANFTQADFTGRATLEVNQVFGGTRLVVPPHWEIQSELNAVFGSVEDKRPIRSESQSDQTKVLILEGNAIFGGIEIHSF